MFRSQQWNRLRADFFLFFGVPPGTPADSLLTELFDTMLTEDDDLIILE